MPCEVEGNAARPIRQAVFGGLEFCRGAESLKFENAV